MIGIDTTLLVAHEIRESPSHSRVRECVREMAVGGERFALAPQVLQEFLHVVTDPRRFDRPLSVTDALERVSFWWRAAETVRCFADEQATLQAMEWMKIHRLGRKRILDTFLAAVYFQSGVRRLATANKEDFAIFGVFSFESWAEGG